MKQLTDLEIQPLIGIVTDIKDVVYDLDLPVVFCDTCGKAMSEGYMIEGCGLHYCDENCLKKGLNWTEDDFKQWEANWTDDDPLFWTQWY